jgi:magnesium-transporting ATPase (P-type)
MCPPSSSAPEGVTPAARRLDASVTPEHAGTDLGRRTHHHHLPVHEVVLLLETHPEHGLTHAEAARRLARFGPNVLPHVRAHGPLVRFLAQFHHPLIYILVAAGGITALVGERVDASVIFGVVVVNAIIGYVQEARAERALDALRSVVRTTATVVRDGERMHVDSSNLVPGDLVLVAAGDKVPADVRLVTVEELRVDESALTGESLPVDKAPVPVPFEATLADRSNMAYSGTLAVAGAASGIVIATGADTELGLIHRLVGTASELATPLTRRIAQFSRLLTVAILGLAGATFAIGVARGEATSEMVTAAVALAVGAIPEGLPAVVTITLAVGVRRMARRHVIIRRLPAVETLGSTTVICTDKTGTLTENEMTVQVVVAGGHTYEVTGSGYARAGRFFEHGIPVDAAHIPALRACLEVGLLCNDAALREPDAGGPTAIVGDPTEAALVVAARKAGLDPVATAARSPRLDTLSFDSARRYMATVHRRPSSEDAVVCLKGAVETVVGLCDRQRGADGGHEPLDRAAVLAQADALARRALRVLAVAHACVADPHLPLEPADVESIRFCLAGLQAMADPPRPEALAALEACRDAGIAVKMITGDHAATAQAVARRFGLLDDALDDATDLTDVTDVTPGALERLVLTGDDLARLAPADLPEAVDRAAVFARVSPEQKLRLVEALQVRHHVVAMTGDGVNDAPALKQADIGVAMGIDGTEVAKEAADMVLTDDNFASVEAAVEEGRTVFDNLTKFIVWALPTSMGEGLVIVAAIVAGAALPILPVQVLWVNMITAVALGLVLAVEPSEPGIMQRPPRDPRQPLLTRPLVARIALVSAIMLVAAFGLFEWEQDRGASIAQARTVAVNVFVMVQVTYLLNCRSLERSILQVGVLSNRWVLGGIAAMLGLQSLFTYAPFMHTLFDSAAIDLAAWSRVAGASLTGYGIIGAEKWARRRARPT